MASLDVENGSKTTYEDSGVEQDRRKPGRHNARITEGPRVWLIIATLHRLHGDIAGTADECVISREQVQQAIDYYERNRGLIDAHILLSNEEETAWSG